MLTLTLLCDHEKQTMPFISRTFASPKSFSSNVNVPSSLKKPLCAAETISRHLKMKKGTAALDDRSLTARSVQGTV